MIKRFHKCLIDGPTESAELYKESKQASGARRHQPYFVGTKGKEKKKKKKKEKRKKRKKKEKKKE